jgi:hypothetical protein
LVDQNIDDPDRYFESVPFAVPWARDHDFWTWPVAAVPPQYRSLDLVTRATVFVRLAVSVVSTAG